MNSESKVVESAGTGSIDSVLLIDGDNDPHFPADFEVGERTLVRVFLRMSATIPRTLEKRLGAPANCVAVVATKTGGNAADFVMAVHAGILHATLPMHLPFTIVTNDQGLSVIAQEFQRLGRQTTLWTSHAKRGRAAADSGTAAPRAASHGRRRGGRGRGRGKAAAPPPAPVAAAPSGAGDGALEGRAAASYAQHLARIKDPPSRLKSLLSDIAARSKPAGSDPKAVLDLLVGAGIVTIDSAGRVKRGTAG
ncbi:MAG: hypothetical protein HY553_12840 [Elusimicrobia bacterium]|nr:hypothetical protein [Elusimicrobiota bacterium]